VYTRLFYATVQPAKNAEAWTVLDELLPRIRAHEGCLQVQVLQGGDDLVGITDWTSKEALAAYADGDVARELFSRLTPLLMGAPTTRSYLTKVTI
jgi:quinol monooxygenase YgiN